MGWYSEISRDVSKITDAVAYFESELQDARNEVKLKGNVERAAAEMPGIVEHRFNQLQEIEAILNYLNIELRRLRSSFFKKYVENYQRALSSRDVEKYVAYKGNRMLFFESDYPHKAGSVSRECFRDRPSYVSKMPKHNRELNYRES